MARSVRYVGGVARDFTRSNRYALPRFLGLSQPEFEGVGYVTRVEYGADEN